MNLLKSSDSSKTFPFLLLIFSFGILIYLPSTRVPFINDEIAFIERNQVSDLSKLYTLFEKKEYDGEYYRPLPNFISGFTTYFFKYNFIFYRIFNLLLHAAAGLLVFILCSSLLKEHPRIKYISLFAALFFLAFPLLDYPVIWHTDLFDRIMLLFYIYALISFINNNFKPGITSSILFVLSLLSKEMALSFPLVIFLTTLFFREKKFNWIISFANAVPYAVISLAFILFRIIFFDNNIFTVQGAHSVNSFFTIIKNYFFFGGLLIFPFFIREIEQLIVNNKFILLAAGSLILFFSILLYKKRKKDIILLFFILFIIITIAPASRLLMRWYLYLPSIGYTAAVSYFIFTTGFKTKYLLGISIIILMAYTTALLFKENMWIENSTKADLILKNFTGEYGIEVRGKGIDFLTIPAKVNDIPVFQLGFDHHINYYLHENDAREVNVYSKSVLSSLEDSIALKKTNYGFYLKQFRDNYFILFGNQKNIKFDSTNYEAMVQEEKNRREQGIKTIVISPEVKNKILFTFSNGRFIKISDSVPNKGNGKD